MAQRREAALDPLANIPEYHHIAETQVAADPLPDIFIFSLELAIFCKLKVGLRYLIFGAALLDQGTYLETEIIWPGEHRVHGPPSEK